MPRLKTLPPRVTTKLKRQVSTSPQQRVRGSKWQTVRAAVMRRANGLCECSDCRLSGRLLLAEEVDHVVPLHLGGASLDPDNLAALSKACHRAKSDREATERSAAGGA